MLFSIYRFNTMYSIYVTNKSGYNVYIRLQHEKMSAENPNFPLELDNLKGDKTKVDNVNSYLVRWGFCLIIPHHTMSVPIDVGYHGQCKYASLFAHSKLWTMDYEMNCVRYGCLFIKSSSLRQICDPKFYLDQANPEPVWIKGNKGEAIPKGIVKAGPQTYVGRTPLGDKPCQVTVTGNQLDIWCGFKDSFSHGEILRNNGHEFFRAKTGDLMPPHAVITGVSEPEGSLYLGRVGGNIPCSVSTEGGRIKSFCYGSKKVQSGEILVLTNAPDI